MSAMLKDGNVLLASYEYLDSTVDAIENLRKAGFKTVKAYAPYPEHHIEAALGYGQSPVRVFTLVGGLTGTATGLAKSRTGTIEAIRVITVARRSAGDEWIAILNQMRHLVSCAPDEIRARFLGLSPITLVRTTAALNRGAPIPTSCAT